MAWVASIKQQIYFFHLTMVNVHKYEVGLHCGLVSELEG